MLISVSDLANVWGVSPSGVLHVGAHEAEEADAYAAQGWKPVWWVEMLPDKYALLEAKFSGSLSNHVLHAACWDEDGVEVPVHRADNEQSSSLLAPREHLDVHPAISFRVAGTMTTTRLDTLLPTDAVFDFVNLDTQGAELRALRGLGVRLQRVTWVYAEVNVRLLYEGCCLLGDLDGFMRAQGFRRVATRMAGPAVGWGDALYVSTAHLAKRPMRAALTQARWKAEQWAVRWFPFLRRIAAREKRR